MTKCGAQIVERFVDDFGNEVFPYRMEYESFMARYYFYSDLFL